MPTAAGPCVLILLLLRGGISDVRSAPNWYAGRPITSPTSSSPVPCRFMALRHRSACWLRCRAVGEDHWHRLGGRNAQKFRRRIGTDLVRGRLWRWGDDNSRQIGLNLSDRVGRNLSLAQPGKLGHEGPVIVQPRLGTSDVIRLRAPVALRLGR